MVVEYDPRQLDIMKHSLYSIVCVFMNNTIPIHISEHIQERFNVRKDYYPTEEFNSIRIFGQKINKLRLDPWWEIV